MEYKSLINKLTALSIVAFIAISATSCGMTETNNSINSNLSHPIELVEDDNKSTNNAAEKSEFTISNEKQVESTSTSIITPSATNSISTSKQADTITERKSIKATTETIERPNVNDNNADNVTSPNCDSNKQVTTYSTCEEQTDVKLDSTSSSHEEKKQVTTYSEIEYSDTQNNETASTTTAQKYVQQGNGNVLLIAEYSDLMGNQPFRVSKEESEMLINMFNEIELVPVDKPVSPDDPLDEVWGGGYIMYIEGGNKITIMGNRNVKIDDNYYYDANNKSDALSGQIGYVLYGYYGEP